MTHVDIAGRGGCFDQSSDEARAGVNGDLCRANSTKMGMNEEKAEEVVD